MNLQVCTFFCTLGGDFVAMYTRQQYLTASSWCATTTRRALVTYSDVQWRMYFFSFFFYYRRMKAVSDDVVVTWWWRGGIYKCMCETEIANEARLWWFVVSKQWEPSAPYGTIWWWRVWWAQVVMTIPSWLCEGHNIHWTKEGTEGCMVSRHVGPNINLCT